MPQVIFQTPDDRAFEIDAEAGTSAMKAAVNNDVPGIVGECGGDMTCATCHVHVADEWSGKLPERGEEEEELLEMVDGFCDRSRLSCQIKVSEDLDGITLRVPLS